MKIKNKEALFATVNFITVKIFALSVNSMMDIGKNSAWLFFLINTAFTAFAFLCIHLLYKKSGYRDLFLCIPPLLRKALGIISAAYFIISSALMLDILIKGVIRTFMPDSPILFIGVFFIAAVIYASGKGIKNNISPAMIIAPLLSFVIVVSVVLLPYSDFTNIFPILGNNDFYLKAIYGFNFFSDFFVFILMMPYLEEKKNSLKTGLIAILVSAVLCTIVILSAIFTIPDEAKFFSPFYYMVTFLSGSRSAVNFVKILKLSFLLNFFLYFSTAVAFGAESLKRGFNLKYEKELVPLLALIVLFMLQIGFGKDVIFAYNAFMKYSFLIFPLLPLSIYLFSKKKGKM